MKPLFTSGHARVFAMTGALAFAVSMLYAAYVYGVTFSHVTSASSAARPLAIDVALFAVFALHHSIFARAGLKQRVRAWAGPDAERSVYVWIASVLFVLMLAGWQPVPGLLWRATGLLAWLLPVLQLMGLALMVGAGRFTDVRDLAGLRGPDASASRPIASVSSRGPYAVIRHPLYLAFLLLLWPMRDMTHTRLLFAALFTVYVVVAIPLEERDLRRAFGDAYERYAKRVRYRLVPGVY